MSENYEVTVYTILHFLEFKLNDSFDIRLIRSPFVQLNDEVAQ